MSPFDARGFQLRLLLLISLCAACTPIRDREKPSSVATADGKSSQPVETSESGKQNKADAAMPAGGDRGDNMTTAVMTGSAACAARQPGDLYCDEEANMHVCLSATASRAVPCGDLEHCVVISGRPQCRCVPGAVLEDSQCVMGTTCAVDNGGCDPLTMCTSDAAGRACGKCPDGYTGDGLQGCAPELSVLKPSCGELMPPLAAGKRDYRLRVPLICHALTFETKAPANTHLTANGAELAGESATWPFSPIKYGESTLVVNVISEFGVSAKYNIVVERTGGQEAYIKASNAEAEDMFGFSLTAAADELFVGAPWEDSGSLDPNDNSAATSGAVYGFVRQKDGWAQTLYLKPDNISASDAFGTSVLLAGDTLFVGAVGQDPLQWYAGGLLGSRSGAVYVFARQNGAWKQTQRLAPSAAVSGDLFGFRIALHDKTLAVSAPGDGSAGLPKSGAVYVFQLEAGAWVEKQKLQPPTAPNGGDFGLGLSLDADQLLVGAPADSARENLAGAAYVYTRQAADAQWKFAQRLEPRAARAQATLGWQVLIRGDTALVTAPGVVRVGPPGELSIFERAGGTWMLRDTKSAAYPADANLYGGGLDLSGSVLAVGSNGDSSGASGVEADASRMDSYQSGAVYLYAQSPMGWVPTTYIKASNPDPDDQFGVQVVAAPGGIIVGAPYESGASRKINGDAASNTVSKSGAVYVFH